MRKITRALIAGINKDTKKIVLFYSLCTLETAGNFCIECCNGGKALAA